MSEGLKALSAIKSLFTQVEVDEEEGVILHVWQEHEKATNAIEKELKALELLKNKRVNLEYLKCCETYEQYCFICGYGREITQQEFDSLKEVFNDK